MSAGGERTGERTVVILATLDTKAEEADHLRAEIESLGGRAVVVDLGVIGTPGTTADIGREAVAQAGGTGLDELLENPSRETAAPVMVVGATKILLDLIAEGRAHAVLGVGGTQGTSSCTAVMRALPYGFPKLMVSTVASGDTAPFVGIKDIAMMFSVSDLLGVNRLTGAILSNAAAAAYGMSLRGAPVESGAGERPLIAMTNLGVLTAGATLAVELFREAGYEVVVFHAVGSGGRAMEQLMKEGIVGAVFDYALGEIADDVFGGLRAGGAERLTVAGRLGLPQVIVPGGAEHLGLFVEEDTVPDEWADHAHVFHSPVIFVPRLRGGELVRVARSICERLGDAAGSAVMMLPLGGVGRYSVAGGPLHDPEADRVFFDALRDGLPDAIRLVEVEAGAEDPAFVRACVDELLAMLE
ncbi:MAG: Tm-1-like ATP-binding domain-containing protein [Gemmatimonadota bacterium]|nr:Tm-1-like ATP-binding domain-containing protein [Gemmatimonadota bacterium]